MWLHQVSVDKNVHEYISPKLYFTPEIKSKYFRIGECVGIGKTTVLPLLLCVCVGGGGGGGALWFRFSCVFCGALQILTRSLVSYSHNCNPKDINKIYGFNTKTCAHIHTHTWRERLKLESQTPSYEPNSTSAPVNLYTLTYTKT